MGTTLGSGIAAVLAVAVTVLIALRLIYGGRRASDPVVLVLHTLAWTAVYCAVFGCFIVLFHWTGLLLWLACGGVAILTFGQLRVVYQRTLLRLLAMGVEKQMPLPDLIAAFSNESSGRKSRRTQRLAQQLASGMSLQEALERTRGLVPRYTQTATEVGLAVGDLGRALTESAMTLSMRRPLWHVAAGRIYYLGWLFVTLPAILAFLLYKIVPSIDTIMADYDAPGMFDPATEDLIVGTMLTVASVSSFAALFLVGYFTLHYLGFLRLGLPGLNWFLRPFESGVVLRFLALAAERSVPLKKVLLPMAKTYPLASMRWRLRDVTRDIDNGENWSESLRKRGVISRNAAAVLAASERVGNISWALRILAESGEQRLARRLEAWSRAAFIAIILLVAAAVGYISILFFLPLVRMIDWMAR
jgi:general secretion pathway protein F